MAKQISKSVSKKENNNTKDKSIDEKQWDPLSVHYNPSQRKNNIEEPTENIINESSKLVNLDDLIIDPAIPIMEEIVVPDAAEEKPVRINEIKESLKVGQAYFNQGNFKEAEKELVKVIKPVLSKSVMKDLYVKLDDVKEEALAAMYHLGFIYLHDTSCFNNYAKATGIFQYCAAFAKKYHIGDAEFYLNQAHKVESDFLKSIDVLTSEPTNSRESLELYKGELEDFRDEVKARIASIKGLTIEEIDLRADIVEEIYNDCGDFFVKPQAEPYGGLMQRLLADCYRQLGNPPEGCKHAIIGLGSLALGTMTLWSDLEFAILVNEDVPIFKEYFRNLTKLLHIKIINLGETPLRSLGIESLNNFKTGELQDEWFWDDVMKIKFNFDGPRWDACKLPLGRQGGHRVTEMIKNEETGIDEKITIIKPDYELILTPDEMANFQREISKKENEEHKIAGLGKEDKKAAQVIIQEIEEREMSGLEVPPAPTAAMVTNPKSWFESDRHLVQALRSVSLIDGSQELLDEYRSKVLQVATPEILEKRALQILEQDLNKFSLKLGDEEEGKLIDSKMHIYRLGDRVINSLGNYYNLTAEVGTPKLTVWEMIEKLPLSPEGAQHLKEAVAIATELRLTAYSHNDTRSESVSTYVPAVEHLEEEDRHRLIEETFHMDENGIELLYHFYYVMLRTQYIIKTFYDNELQEHTETFLKYDDLFDDSNYSKGMVYARFLAYDQALIHMEAAKEVRPEDLNLLQDLLFLYNKLGTIEDTITVAQKMLELSKNEHKDDPSHPNIVLNYNNLGSAHGAQGKYDCAIKCYEQALELSRKVYETNPIHPDIALCYNNLGAAHNANGEYDQAIKYYTKALKINLKAYKSNPNHSDIALSYNNLGNAHENKGEYDCAIKYHQRALKIKLKAYENIPNHPDVALSFGNLGNAYENKGEHDYAIKYHQQALKIKLKAFESNPNHPSIAISYNNLASSHESKEEYDWAIEYYHKSLKINLKVYETTPNHSAICASYNNLGAAHENKGEHDHAIAYLKQALKLNLKAFENNPNHPNIALSYNNLGASYESKGKYDQAIENYKQSLKIKLKAYESSPNHPSIGTSYNNLGTAHEAQGKYDQGLLYAKKALDIFCQHQNQQDITMARVLANRNLIQLGNQSLLNSNEDAAREYYSEIDHDYKDIDFCSKTFIDLQLYYVDIVYKRNDLLSDINCHEVLVKIDPELKHGNHYHNLACFYACRGNIAKARESFIRAFSYFEVEGGLHVEYAQFLITNRNSNDFIVSSQEISNHLYIAINSGNRGDLNYGKMEQNSICAILAELINQKNNIIETDSQTLAYYLLIKNPQYIKEDDNIESLLQSFTSYCENLQEEIAFRLLSDTYRFLDNQGLSDQYLAKAELIMQIDDILSHKQTLSKYLEIYKSDASAMEVIEKYITDLNHAGQFMLTKHKWADSIKLYHKILQIYQSIIVTEPEKLQEAANNIATIIQIINNVTLKNSGAEIDLNLKLSGQDVPYALHREEYIQAAAEEQQPNENLQYKTFLENIILSLAGDIENNDANNI